MLNLPRMATNAEGEAIHRLVEQAGFKVTGIDWSRIAPFWLVVEMNEKIVGCIQVCLSLPIGRIEMLSVDKDVPHITRSRIFQMLAVSAASTLKAAGAQMATMLISFQNKPQKKLLKKRGCVSISTGNLMAKRL